MTEVKEYRDVYIQHFSNAISVPSEITWPFHQGIFTENPHDFEMRATINNWQERTFAHSTHTQDTGV